MNAYTELRDRFDHLQKRALQLFDIGQKREGRLETAVANAWKYFNKISTMDDIDSIHELSAAMAKFMSDTLADNQAIDSDTDQTAGPTGH